jgi:hypothetical protein
LYESDLPLALLGAVVVFAGAWVTLRHHASEKKKRGS